MDNKMKVKIGAMVAILLIVIYMAVGMFSGPSQADAPTMRPNPDIPKKGEILPTPPKPAQQSAAQAEGADAKFLAMQQELQAKYMNALNELQMLRINKDIAETNKAIMKAKEDIIKSQSNIVNLLAPPKADTPPPRIDVQRVDSAAANTATQTPQPPPTPTPPSPTISNDLTVVSVSNLRGSWTAVINDGRSLYKVGVGDVIPGEEANVTRIDRSGVTVEKDGEKFKILMTSIM